MKFSQLYTKTKEKIEPALLVLYWLCLLGSIIACIVFLIHLLSARIAIGVLGALGVVVALREKAPTSQKFLWAVITLVLLVVDVLFL